MPNAIDTNPPASWRCADQFIQRPDGRVVDAAGNLYTGYTPSGTYYRDGEIDDTTPPLFFRFEYIFLSFLKHRNIWELK